jgi:hypothetical protein
MKPFMLCPGDKIKLIQDGSLTHTLKEYKNIPSEIQDEPQRFLELIQKISKGSVLEVSQIYIKNRKTANYITLKIVAGIAANEYNKYIVQNDILTLKIRIKELKDKIKTMDSKDKYRSDVQYEINNRQKLLDKLTKKDKKTGFTKLFKINLNDIESWDVDHQT